LQKAKRFGARSTFAFAKGLQHGNPKDGTLVHDAAQLTVGAKIYLRFAKGQATANIDAIEKDRP